MVDVIEYAKKMHVELDFKPRADAYCEIHMLDRLHNFHEVKVVKDLEVRGLVGSQLDDYLFKVLDEMASGIDASKAMLHSQRLRKEQEEEMRKFWRESNSWYE